MFGISVCVFCFLWTEMAWKEEFLLLELSNKKPKKKQKTNKKSLAKIESIQVLCNGRDIVTGVLHVISLAAKD